MELLDPQEARVLGCLAEKQLTTPAQYPLTLNALVLGCNQTSSRDPVVSYDDATVEAVVTRAKTKGLARFLHPSHGRSALRFAHTLDEALGLEVRELALLAVLLLRGPQTLAELFTRTQRMATFTGPPDVAAALTALAHREPPLVRRLDRSPGQREERYVQLLAVAAPAGEAPTSPGPHPPPAPSDTAGTGPVAEPGPVPTPGPVATPEDPRAEIEALWTEVRALRRDVDDLRAELGG